MDTSSRDSNAELNKNLKRLNRNLEKENSVARNIWMGIIKGAAGAVGATLVAGIILTILARTLDSAKDISILKPFLGSGKIQESIEKK